MRTSRWLFLIAALGSLLAAPALAQSFKLGATINLAVNGYASDVAVADVSGDGRADLLVTDESGVLQVRLANDSGGYGAPTEFAVGYDPYRLAVGDLNGDDKLDVVIAGFDGTIWVLLGDGDGGFGAATSFPGVPTVGGLVVEDFNGDGRLDVAESCQNSAVVAVFFGDGSGSLAPLTYWGVGRDLGLACGDFNGDGWPDLVVPTMDFASVGVILNDGAGGFGVPTEYPAGAFPSDVAVGDLNRDGKLDLAVCNVNDNSVSVLLGNGAGGFGPKTDYLTGAGPYGIQIGDLTGDGIPDIATANYNAYTVSVLTNDGFGGLSAPISFDAPFKMVVTIADINGDGRGDVAAAGGGGFYGLALLTNNQGGGYRSRLDYATGTDPRGVACADLNRDGRADVVVANAGLATVSVRLGSEAGLGPQTDYPTGNQPYRIAIGDLNLDGWPDLVTSNISGPGSLSVLLGTGGGSFGPKTDLPYAPAFGNIALGDLNADNHLDLVFPDASGTFSVMLGNGLGGFGPRTTYSAGTSPQAVALADLSRDGKLDVAVTNWISNNVTVRLGNGNGTFAAATSYPTGTAPDDVAIADLDADGWPELIVANAGLQTVSIFAGTGGGSFGTRFDITVVQTCCAGPSIAIGDVDGDGRPDLVTLDYGANLVSVRLGNGILDYFGPNYDYPDVAASKVAIGDVNGDGRPDIVVAPYAQFTPHNMSLFLAKTLLPMTFTTDPAPALVGTPVTYAARPTPPSLITAVPTGTVRFFDGTNPLGSAPLVDGVATLSMFERFRGKRSLMAVYSGDAKFFGRHGSRGQRAAAHAGATVLNIRDVPNDQGRSARVRFEASPYDVAGSSKPIVRYDLYRRIAIAAAARLADVEARPAATPLGATMVGWDYVASVPAETESEYAIVVPTLADSNSTGFHRAVIIVRAATANPGVTYDSPADSGYSVDNLAPATPTPFTGAFAGGATHLHWGVNLEPDLWHYRIYRGTSSSFVPGPTNIIAAAADTGYADPGVGGRYYKLSAMDVNGNESGFALLSPNGTVDVPAGEPVAFALERVSPNPWRGERLTVSFALARPGPARLELLDIGGRRLAAHDVGAMGPGRHQIALLDRGRIPPGVYLVRLSQDREARVIRVVVLE